MYRDGDRDREKVFGGIQKECEKEKVEHIYERVEKRLFDDIQEDERVSKRERE